MVLMLILSLLAVAGCVAAPFVQKRRRRRMLLYGVLALIAATIAVAFLVRSGNCQISIDCAKGPINKYRNYPRQI